MNISNRNSDSEIRDFGGEPVVVNINRLARLNRNYRTALWTGEHLQVTLMSIGVGGDIGLEMHDDVDQFIRVESGRALVKMGGERDRYTLERYIDSNYAVMVPAGTWHNIINAGNMPLKLYSVYAPPQHPFDTVHPTKESDSH